MFYKDVADLIKNNLCMKLGHPLNFIIVFQRHSLHFLWLIDITWAKLYSDQNKTMAGPMAFPFQVGSSLLIHIC